MSRRGGYGGIPANMNNMLKQAERMRRQMEEQQKVLAESEFTGTSGGGAVTVILSGERNLRKITIDPEVLDPEDTETLEELILMAFNNAAEQVSAAGQKLTGGYTGL